jgi:hypothetical protein
VAQTASDAGPAGAIADALGSRTALAILAAVNVTPLLVTARLPFTDWPEHLAVTASLVHWNEPAWRIAEHYELQIGRSPYLLYHLASAAAAFVIRDVEAANRLLIAGSGLALPFALRALLRALGRDVRLSIFALPLFWNRALALGFVPYVASMPVILWALARAVRQSRLPDRAMPPGLSILAVVCFYLHVSAYVLLVASALLLAMVNEAQALRARRDLRPAAAAWSFVAGGARRVGWLAPSAGFVGLWMLAGRLALSGDSLGDAGEIGRIALTRAAYGFELWTHDIWRSSSDEACAVAYWSAFAWMGVARLRLGRASPGRNESGAARQEGSTSAPPFVAYVPFIGVLALYLSLPFHVGAAGMLNVRLAPLVAMLAIPLLSWPSSRRVVGPLVMATTAALAVPATNAFEMWRINREEMVNLDTLFDRMERGSRLVALNFRPRSPRMHFEPWAHVAAYHRIRDGGVASWSFSELSHWSLRYRAEAAPPRHAPFWDFNPCVYRNGDDGAYYDYVLVRGDLDPFRDRPPGPAWQPISRAGDFALYGKTGEVWPAWSAPDEGPCRSREDVEAAGQ